MAHFELVNQVAPNAVIKVIGVGGGGGNAVAHMVNSNVIGVEFITANTDSQAIKNCGANVQLTLGCNVTKGLARVPTLKWAGRLRLKIAKQSWMRCRVPTWCSSPPAWGGKHGHRRCTGGGAVGQGNGHPDGGCSHQAVPV